MADVLHADFETFSEVDIKKCGNYRYAQDPSTEILCLSLALNDEEPWIWIPGEDDSEIKHLLKHTDIVAAHNATFEKNIIDYVGSKHHGWPRVPWERLIDTAAIAAYRGYPRSLDGVAKALGLIEQKDPRGAQLIRKLCKPRKPTKHNPATRWTPETAPEDFSDLYDYCIQDVRTERAVHHALGELPEPEQRIWVRDGQMNERGVPINTTALHGAIRAVKETSVMLESAAVRGKPFETLGQREKVMGWCSTRGYPLADYTADTLEHAVNDPECPAIVREVLKARSQTSRTSTKKFAAMLRSLCEDGTIKGAFLYYGAHTGRWAGRLIQGQNLPRPTITDLAIDIAIGMLEIGLSGRQLAVLFEDVMDTLVSCIRGLIIPPEGQQFYCADYSNVEGRVLFCSADDQTGLEVFRNKEDLYKVMAMAIYNIMLHEVDSDQRRMGKLAILGLGYQMGAPKFIATAAEQGVHLSKDFATEVVEAYRGKFDRVPKLWSDCERAAKQAIQNPGRSYQAGVVKYMLKGSTLLCRLPSGRLMHYPKAVVRSMPAPWGGKKDTICYMTEKKRKWVVTKTFGGKLVENIVQAISRDLLVHAHHKVEDKGYRVHMTVHDELVTARKTGTGSVDELIELMTQLPSWAAGWPIEASGWEGFRFQK